MTVPYRFLDDIAIADIAFEAEAQTLPELFSDAVEALLNVQVDNPEAVRSKENVRINVSDSKPDMLLYRFLQEVVYYKDAKRWLLRSKNISIRESPGYKLTAEMTGEAIDPHRHEQRADVKAVTMHRLNVEKTAEGWKATVVVDV